MKKTKRKGFNFFRSYFDVYNELNKKDKVLFMDALLNKQFLGTEPTNLTGLAKFAWISQLNNINSQVRGFEDKTGIKLNPTEPPTEPPKTTPTEQVIVIEKEKVIEKEEGEVMKISDDLIRSIKEIAIDYKKNDRLKKAILTNGENLFKNELEINQRLDDFVLHLETLDQTQKTGKDFKSHFLYWSRKKKEKSPEKKEEELNWNTFK